MIRVLYYSSQCVISVYESLYLDAFEYGSSGRMQRSRYAQTSTFSRTNQSKGATHWLDRKRLAVLLRASIFGRLASPEMENFVRLVCVGLHLCYCYCTSSGEIKSVLPSYPPTDTVTVPYRACGVCTPHLAVTVWLYGMVRSSFDFHGARCHLSDLLTIWQRRVVNRASRAILHCAQTFIATPLPWSHTRSRQAKVDGRRPHWGSRAANGYSVIVYKTRGEASARAGRPSDRR